MKYHGMMMMWVSPEMWHTLDTRLNEERC